MVKKKKGRPSGRAWAQERAKRKGGSNVRGSKKEHWERSTVKGHYRKLKGGKKVWVRSYKRHKGKRK